MPIEDAELIRSYVKTGSEDAFAELVSRHVDLVYSTALRRVGNAELAEEVSQGVFLLFAQKAPSLTQLKNLGGWLHRATCFIAAKTIRTEMRRRQRERLAVLMNDSATDSDCWEQIAPQLDVAIDQLPASDRVAIVARFLQSKSIRDVAGALNVSEGAAKKRIARAVEKLHRILSKRGLGATSTVLTALLGSRAVQAAPPALAKIICVSAICGASTTSLLQIFAIMSMKTKLAIAALILAGVATLIHQQTNVSDFTNIAAPIGTASRENETRSGIIQPQMFASNPRETPPPEWDFASLIKQLNMALRGARDGNEILNRATIDAIRKFGSHDEIVFAALTNAVNSSDRLVFSRAMEAMEILDKNTPGLLPFLWTMAGSRDVRGEYAITTLVNLGLEASDLPRLAELLPIPRVNSQVVIASQRAIGQDRDAAQLYLPVFRNFLGPDDPDARFFAACVLARAGDLTDPRALTELAGHLNFEDPVKLGFSVRALADAGPSAAPALPALLDLLNGGDSTGLDEIGAIDPAISQRNELLKAIGAIDPSLRSSISELDALLTQDEEAAHFRQRLEQGEIELPELIKSLAEPKQQDAAIDYLRDLGPAAANAIPALLELLSSTYEKARKDEIETALMAIDPRLTIRHIDSDELAAALDAVESAVDASQSDREMILQKEASRRYYGLINFFTWYTEQNLRDLSAEIAELSPAAHQIFTSKLLASDPSLRDLLQPAKN